MGGLIVRGVPLELHPPGDYVSDVIRLSGDFYEAAILDEVRARLIRRGRLVVVDAGAMIGNHSVYLAEFCGPSEVYAFEPHPLNLPLLRANTERYASVSVHPVALSARACYVRLEADPANRGHVSTTVLDEDEEGMVAAVPLDAYRLPELGLLKLDVEGHEPEVLQGARETIERCRPLVLIEDWHGPGHAQELLPGYRLAAEWEQAHQTFLYEPA